jgi:redox-sensitive bicupin YhaK (pirin superfamily)
MRRSYMGIYRVFTGSDGESHMEELSLEEHAELGALTNLSEVRVQQFDGTRNRDFHPLPERRLIIHLSGEVEIGTSDGSRQVFRAGDIRLMEDVTGRGHTHVDRSPSSAVYVILKG